MDSRELQRSLLAPRETYPASVPWDMDSDESVALNEKEPAEGKDDDLADMPGQVSDSDSSSDEENGHDIPAPPFTRGPCTGSSTRSHAGHPHRSKPDIALWPRDRIELFDLRLCLSTNCGSQWVNTTSITVLSGS